MKKVEFMESETKQNLARAFAGESQAGLRYQILIEKLNTEGYYFLANLMKKVAKNEVSHAKVFYNLLVEHSGGELLENIDISAGYPFKSGDLVELFRLNAENEKMEADSIYTTFADIAKDEGFADVAQMFKLITQVETCHYLLLTQIYEKMKAGKLYKSPQPIKWKCDLCGYEHTSKDAFKVCPICQKEQGYCQVPLDMGKN